ncbi:MAG: RES domain-containing protein [Methylomonas sp.]|jgi:RES domain-containing protein
MLTHPFIGIAYRAHHPKWACEPLSGDGAKKFGGRFNRPGCPALYASLDPTTAWMEAQQGFPFKPQPMTLVAYEVECTDITDLNDENILKAPGYSVQDLSCPWEYLAQQKIEPPTWLLSDKLQSQGTAGVLVRSFASGCKDCNQNLVLWNRKLNKVNSIRMIDDFGRLPSSSASWDNKR